MTLGYISISVTVSMFAGTGPPQFLWVITTSPWGPCCRDIFLESSSLQMAGKNFGWFLPTLACTSTKLFRYFFNVFGPLWHIIIYFCYHRMISHWQVSLCLGMMCEGQILMPMKSTRTLFSNWLSRITFTSLGLKANSLMTGNVFY